jgi:hypothetical protein
MHTHISERLLEGRSPKMRRLNGRAEGLVMDAKQNIFMIPNGIGVIWTNGRRMGRRLFELRFEKISWFLFLY